MGQYHLFANITKREFFRLHEAGVKMVEIAANNGAAPLVPLLAISNNRGGGDLKDVTVSGIKGGALGRWAGDHVLLVGDYTEPGDILGYPHEDHGIRDVYDLCLFASFTDGELDDHNASRTEAALKHGSTPPPPLTREQLFTDITPLVEELLRSEGIIRESEAA